MSTFNSSSAAFKQFTQNAIDLAKTIVIKHSLINEAINNALTKQGYNINFNLSLNDPNYEFQWRTWKYYQNLAGLYYMDANLKIVDTPMSILTVVNDGTIQPIQFNIFNLAQRPSTYRAYIYGSYLYSALVTSFPLQESLIQGVLNTVSTTTTTSPLSNSSLTSITNELMDQYYNSADGTIIQYNTQYIEAQETDLIASIQSWINIYFRDWFNPQYTITDDMYLPTALGVLYALLPSIIMNIRLNNCRTIRAHSFHIQQYLESSGRLGKYVPYMNNYQMLWLHRNIKWVQKNAGKQSTFNTLIDNIMTAGNLPISAYDIYQDLNPLETYSALLPNVNLKVIALNTQNIFNPITIQSVNYVLNKEVALSRNYDLNVNDTEQLIIEKIQTSPSSKSPTKVLESIYADAIDAVVYPLPNILLKYWPYMASLGLYETDIYVTPPGSNAPILLSPLNAFILYIYAWNYGSNLDKTSPLELTTVPTFKVDDVLEVSNQMFIYPTLNQAKSIVDSTALPNNYYGTNTVTTIIDPILNRPVFLNSLSNWYSINPIQNMLDILSTGLQSVCVAASSPDQFYLNCTYIQNTMMLMNNAVSNADNFRATGYLNLLAKQPFIDYTITLSPTNETYSTWLKNNGINFNNVSQTTALNFAYSILEQATGTNLKHEYTVFEIQNAMLEVMSALSSYSVQYLQTDNSNIGLIENASVVEVGNWATSMFDMQYTPMETIRVLSLDGSVGDYFNIEDSSPIEIIYKDFINDGIKVLVDSFLAPSEIQNDFIQITIPTVYLSMS